MKPKVVLPLAATEPFHDSLRIVTFEPEPERTPPQIWVMVCEPGQVQFTVQPLTGEFPARTVTSPCQPPDQALTARIVAEHAPFTPPDGEGLGLGDGLGLVFGLPLGDGLGLGERVGLGLGLGEGLESDRVGVVQSLHCDRLPDFLEEIRNTPGVLPVFSRNFWMFCCSGVRHSDRVAQWVPSWTSDQ